MNTKFGDGIADSALIMLAELILKRAGLKGLFVHSRKQAISIIRGVKIPQRNQPHGIKPAVDRPTPCNKCGAPVHFGQPCKAAYHRNVNEHIECKQKRALYDRALASLVY